MIVGVPREIKSDEYRVAMLPRSATIVETHEEVFVAAELIVNVNEPMESEWLLLQAGQIVFTYFHFAADRELTLNVMESKATAVAYETLQGRNNDLPLLTPMSEVAGRMSVQQGTKFLERPQEGRGKLLGAWRPTGSYCHSWRRRRGEKCREDRCRLRGGRRHHGYQR